MTEQQSIFADLHDAEAAVERLAARMEEVRKTATGKWSLALYRAVGHVEGAWRALTYATSTLHD